jgi:hypothetical protein
MTGCLILPLKAGDEKITLESKERVMQHEGESHL